MSKRLLTLSASLLLAGFAFAGPASAKEWKTVTIALEGAYAPWNLTNPDGTLGGFEPELAKILCEHMKVECKLIASDWDSMITSLNAGKFDVMMDAVSITEERKQVIDFSIPYAATHASFAALADSDLVKVAGTGTVVKMTPDFGGADAEVEAMRKAFEGKTIGIQAATVYAKFIYDKFGDVATVREYKTGAERPRPRQRPHRPRLRRRGLPEVGLRDRGDPARLRRSRDRRLDLRRRRGPRHPQVGP